MIGTTTQTYDIRRVHDVVTDDQTANVVFEDGSQAALDASHPDHDMMLFMARWGLQNGRPLGVVLDGSGRLLDLSSSDESQVRFIRDEGGSRLQVAFWATSPVYYLCRDHPEFERLRSTLERAMASRSPVRFAHHPRPEQSEGKTWLKLMDVRPLGSNGAAPVT